MKHYIDKDIIVAEIEKRIKEISKECEESKTIQFTLIGKINALENLLPFLNTLDVKEVDLEEERIKECPFKKVGCEMYEGHILECKGTCSWVVDHLKLKELKAQKEE